MIDDSLTMPNEIVDRLICKQLIQPLDLRNSVFVQQFFAKRYFKNEDLSDIYQIALNFKNRYDKLISKDALIQLLKNDKFKDKEKKMLSIVGEVLSFDETKFAPAYISDIILKATKERACYFALLESVDEIDNTKDMGNCLKRIENVSKISMDNDELGIEYFENLDNHIQELTNKEQRIPFDYEEWDKLTYGGIPINEACLFVIMAQPGLGKSQMMMNLGANWLLQNKKVLMVSLEMSESMYSRRMSAILSDINVNMLREETDKLKHRVETVKLSNPKSSLRIKQYSPNEFNAIKLKVLLQKLKETRDFVPDFIIVDYLNIMSTNASSAKMNSYERVGTISKELRSVSIETKIPIITATQSNRCLDPNTKVVIMDKNKNKKEEIKLKELRIGDLILGNNGFNKVKNIWYNKQKTYKITLKSGKTITCSSNHIFPTNKGELSIDTGLKPGLYLNTFK